MCSAYEIDALKQSFDLVYCRFVLHHLHHPSEVIAKVFQPLLTTREEKKLLLLGREEQKTNYLEQGHSEVEWNALGKAFEELIENEAQIVGFFGSCQVTGVRT